MPESRAVKCFINNDGGNLKRLIKNIMIKIFFRHISKHVNTDILIPFNKFVQSKNFPDYVKIIFPLVPFTTLGHLTKH